MIPQISAVLRYDKKKADKNIILVPVYIKIRVNGEQQFKSTSCWIEDGKGYWDKNTQSVSAKHPNHSDMNKQIAGLKTKFQNEATMQMINPTVAMTANSIVTRAEQAVSDKVNLFTTVEAIAEYRKTKPDDFKAKTIGNYYKILNKLEKYHKSKELCYEDITVKWLEKYHTYLKEQGTSVNYINGIFRMIRTFVKMGIKKEVITYNPFVAFDIPSTEDNEKELLTLDELKKFEKVLPKLSGTQLQAVTYFLFGCYSGLRVSDWARFNPNIHLANDGLVMNTKKTESWLFVPYYSKLEWIIEKVKQTPLTISDNVINREIKLIAAELDIDKHLSTHCARKTFAVTMCSDNGISCEVCASMMGITVQVCMDSYYRVNKDRVQKEATHAWKKVK